MFLKQKKKKKGSAMDVSLGQIFLIKKKKSYASLHNHNIGCAQNKTIIVL